MARLDNSRSWSNSLVKLKEGNQRFLSGVRSIESLTGSLRLSELAEKGQNPFAIILSCSDSRVPAEHVFDCGFGDLFVVRVAGNIVQPSQIASIEYAVHVLDCRLLVVMGHTKCGAIQATINSVKDGVAAPSTSIKSLVELIRPPVEDVLKVSSDYSSSELLNKCISANVEYVSKKVLEISPLLCSLANSGVFAIHNAVFQLETGKVQFIESRKEKSLLHTVKDQTQLSI